MPGAATGTWNMSWNKTVHMAPGIYRLEAAARTDGHGCEIFAISGGKEQKTQVPIYSNEGGGIWQDAKKETERRYRLNWAYGEISPKPMEERAMDGAP